MKTYWGSKYLDDEDDDYDDDEDDDDDDDGDDDNGRLVNNRERVNCSQ